MKKTAAIILAGGQGRRMDGADKGLQKYKGRPMIAWVIDALQPQVDSVAISINRNQKKYALFGLTTVLDQSDFEWQGPIAGILTAIKTLDDKSFSNLLICPCDSPNISSNFVQRLEVELDRSNVDVAVVHDGKRIQNLHCLIDHHAIKSLQQYYDNGGRAMHGWLKQVTSTEVDFSDQAETFINLNTFEELDA